MSLGASGGTGRVSQSSPAADQLMEMASQLLGEQAPLRTSLSTTLRQILMNQGEMDFTEAGSLAEDSARVESSYGIQDTKRELERTGLSGTPYGAAMVAKSAMTGREAISTAEATAEEESKQRQQALYQTVLSLIPGYLTGTQSAVAGGLGASIGGTTTEKGTSVGGKAGLSLK